MQTNFGASLAPTLAPTEPEADINSSEAFLLLGSPRSTHQVSQRKSCQRVVFKIVEELSVCCIGREKVPCAYPDKLLPQAQAAVCSEFEKRYYQVDFGKISPPMCPLWVAQIIS